MNTKFSGNTANYKTQIFLSAFDGYAYNNNVDSSYYILISLSPIVLNTNQQSINLYNLAGYYSWMNYLSYTYIMIDLTSFLHTPITQYHENTWIPLTIQVSRDFDPEP